MYSICFCEIWEIWAEIVKFVMSRLVVGDSVDLPRVELWKLGYLSREVWLLLFIFIIFQDSNSACVKEPLERSGNIM